MVKRSPFAWVEAKALDYDSLQDLLARHHPQGHVVSYPLISVIFFEETAFCNISQAGTAGNLGCGFGQLEMRSVSPDFWAWLQPGVDTNYRAVANKMLSDASYSVYVHCNWFQWLVSEQGLSLDGVLSAQVGGSNAIYKNLFRTGAQMLANAEDAEDRDGMIQALNYARANSPKKNGIPEKNFPDFWEFIVPSSEFCD